MFDFCLILLCLDCFVVLPAAFGFQFAELAANFSQILKWKQPNCRQSNKQQKAKLAKFKPIQYWIQAVLVSESSIEVKFSLLLKLLYFYLILELIIITVFTVSTETSIKHSFLEPVLVFLLQFLQFAFSKFQKLLEKKHPIAKNKPKLGWNKTKSNAVCCFGCFYLINSGSLMKTNFNFPELD